MNAKTKLIKKHLDQFFPDPPVPLNHFNTYSFLIAVLLSAQCTDKKVNEVTPLLFAKASSPDQMKEIPQETIQSIIRPCGLSPKKSKAIKELSRILVEHFQGKVPKNIDDLQTLPGVGHKTASVVVAQAFGIPAFPVDTHIHRCAKRWGLSDGKNVEQTEKDLKKAFPKTSWIKLHLQIIYYAREFCPARRHNVEECPICSDLTQYQN